MKRYSYESTFRIEDESSVKDIFGDIEEYENKQKRFGEAATKDALSFFHNSFKIGDTPQDTIKVLENIAVSMYFRGFNRAFEYYVKQEDVFNLKEE